MTSQPSLHEIEEAISHADPEVQKQLLSDLPHLLKLDFSDLALLKVAEKSFDFWNNADDSVYDRL